MNRPTPPTVSSAQARNEAQYQKYCRSQIEFGPRNPAEVFRNAFESTLLNPTTAGLLHSRLETPEPLDAEAPAWDELSRGVQWAIIKLFCENDIPINTSRTQVPFSQVVVVKLGLSRLQIQSFLSVYLDEYEAWNKWDKETAVINWHKLLELAHSRHSSVLDLLPKNRPRLSTDSIPRAAIDKGVSFLHSKRLGVYAGQLSDWIGTNMYGDFVGLKVEPELLHDYLDGKEIRKAACLGWISLEKTHNDIRNKRRIKGMPSEVPGGFFFGNFEGDPTPMGYFPGELEGLQRDRRNSTSAQKARAQNSQQDLPSRGKEPKSQLRKRKPTMQEAQEALRAMERQILFPSKVTAPGHIAASVADQDPRYQLSLPGPLRAHKVQMALAAKATAAAAVPAQTPGSTNAEESTQEHPGQTQPQQATRSRKQKPPQLSVDTRNAENQGAMISKNFSQGSDLALSISHAYSPLRTPVRPPVPGRKPSSSPAEERSARFSEIAHGSGTMRVASENSRSNQFYASGTLRSGSHTATTPVVESPGYIRKSIEEQDDPPYGCEKGTAKSLKRSRKPSRRARDNMESDAEYRPEDDENPQPKKKQRQALSVQKNMKKSVAEQSKLEASQMDGTDECPLTPPQEQLSGLTLKDGIASMLARQRSTNIREPKNLIVGRNESQRIPMTASGRARIATYAWSAQTARFASVATTAKVAIKADHNVSPSAEYMHLLGPTLDARGLEAARSRLQAYERQFIKLESGMMGLAGNDADKAEFAGCADSAEFALDAERAMYILGD